MKKEVFNPDDWNTPNVGREPMCSPTSLSSKGEGRGEALSAILALVDAVEASGIDITPTYSEWLSIAFALVSELGEDGRAIFDRLSRFNPHYEPAETDRLYSHCLHDGSREITIASLFHIANLHGVRWKQLRSSSQLQFEDGEDVRMSKSVKTDVLPTSVTPSSIEEVSKPVKIDTFSQTVREQLPDILKRIVADSVSDVDADLLILGSLTVVSACLPNVYGVYDRREVFSNLFLYVTARASAGKGRLSLCRHLAAPLHRELREQYSKSMEKYKHDQLQYVLNKKKGEATEPQEPPFLTLFIPANSTATVVYQTLSQNNGVGLLFETEGDTLANAFNSDLGNYSDGFRKAFHHETISYLRKKDHEYVEIVKPKFSAVLSGTPQQVFNLIPDAENGLFSRFIFYVMETELVWHNTFATHGCTTADEKFKKIGKDFCAFLKTFPTHPIQFTLSRSQMDQFYNFFEATQLRYAQQYGDEIVASVRRLGLILFRFAMILTVLRQMDKAPKKTKKDVRQLVCSDIDFDSALSMVKVLLQHSAAVFQSLPRNPKIPILKGRQLLAAEAREKFLAALPESFDRPTYLKVAASLNIAVKTAERYLADFCKSGQLSHPANGQYLKTSSRT